MINWAANLPLKFELSGKLQSFNTADGSIKMLKNSWFFKNFYIKWKIVKHFARPKQPAALRKLFNLLPFHPHQIKPYYVSEKKNLFRGIYRHIQIFAFKLLQESSSWASRNGVVQIFFLIPNRNMFVWEFVRKKSESFMAVLWRHYFPCRLSWDS